MPRGTVRGWIEEGIPARRPNALAFIHGLGEDVAEGLREAGFVDDPEKSGSEVLVSGLAALQQELDRPLQIAFKLKPDLTVAEAEQLLATIREQAESGII